MHLSSSPPAAYQVVNGPEVLSKYVGQAEENIRNLFGEAEKEYKDKGDQSVRGVARTSVWALLPPAACEAQPGTPGSAAHNCKNGLPRRTHTPRTRHLTPSVAHSRAQELHIIIFDEIDAICKQRGTVRDGTATHDTIVNQLLTKIDGVDALNNILLIGMTNR